MSDVVQLATARHRETLAALRDLLARAEKGQIAGLMFAIKTSPKRHQIGFTGDYSNDPGEALGCASRMQYKANQLASVRDGSPGFDLEWEP